MLINYRRLIAFHKKCFDLLFLNPLLLISRDFLFRININNTKNEKKFMFFVNGNKK